LSLTIIGEKSREKKKKENNYQKRCESSGEKGNSKETRVDDKTKRQGLTKKLTPTSGKKLLKSKSRVGTCNRRNLEGDR